MKKERKRRTADHIIVRRRRIMELRISGASFRQIENVLKAEAERDGETKAGCSLGQIYADYDAVIKEELETQHNLAATTRIIAVERINKAVLHAMQILNSPSTKDETKIAAANVLIKAADKHADICGAKAAQKIEHTGKDGGPVEAAVKLVIEGVPGSDGEDEEDDG